mgnify:CR=1 FL=1
MEIISEGIMQNANIKMTTMVVIPDLIGDPEIWIPAFAGMTLHVTLIFTFLIYKTVAILPRMSILGQWPKMDPHGLTPVVPSIPAFVKTSAGLSA